jgi:hypothetical protein
VIPVAVTIDRGLPRFVAFKVTALGGNLNVADNRTTDDRTPQLTVSFEDPDLGQLDRSAIRFLFDGVDVTPRTLVSILFTTRATRLALWEGTATYTPADLAEGTHTVFAEIGDRAGNLANATFTFLVDDTAPALAFTAPDPLYTTLDSYTIEGTTFPFAWYRIRGNWTQTDASGAFAETVALVNGTNSILVRVTDWFDEDASGNRLPGNPSSHVLSIVRDLLAPEIPRLSPERFATGEVQVFVTGLVRDRHSAAEPTDPRTLVLEVNGNPAVVRSDGTFRIAVALPFEGTNTITARVVDPAGHEVTTSTSVVRDTSDPTIAFSAEPPTQTESLLVRIAGTTEAGAFVTVNGISVSAPAGAFQMNVTLAYGANTVVVAARDAVGNAVEYRYTVNVVPPAGTSAFLLPAGLAVLGIAIGALLGIVLPRLGVRIPFLPTRGRKERPGEAVESVVAEESVPEGATGEEVAAEETPPEGVQPSSTVPEMPVEDERLARLRKAYEEGRISKEAYEENLRRLTGSRP